MGGDVAIPDRINGLPVTVIGDNAFYRCPGLTAVTIPNGVTAIGAGAFANCASLGKVTLGGAVARIGADAFLESNGLIAFQVDPANTVFASGKDGVIFDKGMGKIVRCPPGKTGTYLVPTGVTTIGPGAFSGCPSLNGVTFAGSVSTIEGSAFANCSRLATVALPASVTKIAPDAFALCNRLATITVDGSNPDYSSSADGIVFNKDKTKLVRYPSGKAGNYTIPPGVTQIEPGAFQGTAGLTGVTIPLGVTSIPDTAFNSCAQLTSVTIPDSVTSIGAWAFYGCTSLTSLTLPNSVTTINECAFWGCTGLVSLTMPANLTTLGSFAFCDCPQLENMTIPASVTSLGVAPFRGCGSVASLDVDPANPAYISVDGVLFDKQKSILLGFPCGRVGDYTIPAGVTTVQQSAFRQSRIASITVPESMTSLGYKAFRRSYGLKYVFFMWRAEQKWTELN